MLLYFQANLCIKIMDDFFYGQKWYISVHILDLYQIVTRRNMAKKEWCFATICARKDCEFVKNV